jgi:hypothetical protein
MGAVCPDAAVLGIIVWSEPLTASFGMKIAPVVAENKHRPIFACQIWRNF